MNVDFVVGDNEMANTRTSQSVTTGPALPAPTPLIRLRFEGARYLHQISAGRLHGDIARARMTAFQAPHTEPSGHLAY